MCPHRSVHPIAMNQHHDQPNDSDKDRGAALILALVMMIIGAMIVLPTLSYTMAVTRHSRTAMARTAGDEVVKGGLRTALADPAKLYYECQGGTRTTIHPIASGIPGATTTCSWLSEKNERDSSKISYSVTTLQSGSTVPADAVPQTAPASWYAASGNTNVGAWIADASADSTVGKIWAPNLPAHALNHPSTAGYQMPAPYPACTVYFPGTYINPVSVTGTTPVFFASGIYYFENTVTFSGSAKVVVGDGAVEGCTTDQEAAFNAIGAPTNHNITGVGATFVFGAGGRLLINDSTPGSGVSVKFNNRYVGATDVNTVSSAGVSIMTVNGKLNALLTGIDPLDLPGQLYVPASLVGSATPTVAVPPSFNPSTNVSSADPLLPAPPMVDISLATAAPVTVYIPGHIAVPQGTVNITTLPTGTAGKDIELVGGIVAAQVGITVDRPSTFVFGAVNAVVQKTFKIETTMTGARSKSTAIVQVNNIGTYYVNSWEVQPS